MSHIDVFHDPHKTYFGFWTYLMTDCILFSILFATYIVLKDGTFGGPTSKDLFDLPFALTETLLLLASSFTSGLAMLDALKGNTKGMFAWFALTFLLGASFLGMELTEFSRFVHEGNSWERSAFLSAFFTLVATHGFHITMGLIWMVVLLVPVFLHGLNGEYIKRLTCFRMFWHFLDVVWIFIFTVVYLTGTIL
ncbi:MAG: cytochrome o ubiquinol oxidase subunit III [Chlamydiae bacterium RIFCSPHIGHO2_12_FULL_49_9]|nr:MAG: cytochrome o ubiquinol oxidase subunit III [Chlamydiae bacterium RIFCSPHIGHO2_12_FULL_49_9]